MFKKVLAKSDCPTDWKKTNFKAIVTKGSKTDTANYCLVSRTSVPCKMFENILYSMRIKHLEKSEILVGHQHGFNPHVRHSVSNMSLIADNLERVNQMDIAVLDFPNTFDMEEY